ncbi:MAG: hypothetical protein HY584_01950 [Candidatus Omnitrophica bacterium]|nr:hypothetical protein [Candidatus Omnitrophota bacterium]
MNKMIKSGVPLFVFILLTHPLFAQSGDEIEKARKVFTPEITGAVLVGDIPAPEGFDQAIKKKIGEERLSKIRSDRQIEGRENDLAALVLMRLGVNPESLKLPERRGRPQEESLEEVFSEDEVKVKFTGAEYKVTQEKPTGFFKSGQDADIVLSAIDFNNTGGPLLFNHPGEIASDGVHLILADRNNNRVLIWNQLPSENVQPDLVLGQKNFITNDPGTGLDQMNWPVSVSAAKGKLVVADTENDRILIWNSFPTSSGQPADLVLATPRGPEPTVARIEWPWGVWTDGTKLAITSTRGSSGVLLWNAFPVRNNQPPDILMTAQGKMGTPRGITSNGQYLLVADHNAKVATQTFAGGFGSSSVTFVWKTWPASEDQPYDFTLEGWRAGTFLPGNRLILLSTTHFLPSIWNAPPMSIADAPDLQVGRQGHIEGYYFNTGDGSDIAWARNRLYFSLSNGNKIVVYKGVPTSQDEEPDFAIGSPHIDTNTLDENFMITNGVVATDGKSLFVSSDFDRRLYVWKSLPNESNTPPDFVYQLPVAPWSNALWGNTLVLAGKNTVYLWKKLPLNGEQPDLTLTGKIGSVQLSELAGVALDDHYFYLTDHENIYVWEEVPSSSEEPKFILRGYGPGRLASDGEFLVGMISHNHEVGVWKVGKLSALSKPSKVPMVPHRISRSFNMPGSAMSAKGHLFVADTGFGRVLIWKNIREALAGKEPDVVLGASDLEDVSQEIGRNKLFWPATLAFDGSYLWIGEFKFSGRILRFSVR